MDAGNAGLPAAIEAVDRGAKVILIEKNDFLGGMLHWSSATMSAAGGSLQAGRPARDSGDIWVNRDGNRFMREDEISPDARERALLEQPGAMCWAVFDDVMREGLTKSCKRLHT